MAMVQATAPVAPARASMRKPSLAPVLTGKTTVLAADTIGEP